MIVCSCNLVTQSDIEEVIESLLVDDPYAMLTPGLIYHRLGKRGKCGGCFPHLIRVMTAHAEFVRARLTAGKEIDDAHEPARVRVAFGR
jgi:bacterioferritin-associated ferredoxin